MDLKLVILLLILIPLIVVGGIVGLNIPMNTLWVVLLGGVMIYLIYTLYARRIDREVIMSDPKKATPAKMYMDGVDFMPTNRNVLYGYHFKSVAAAGPIVGPITAALLWGWLPALLWLIIGVSFIGWVSDYSAIMLSVRNDGNSLSAIAYKLIAPRTRTILFIFIFFYLLLVAGAFVGIMGATIDGNPTTGLAIFGLMIIGLLVGQALYRWKMDLLVVSGVAVVVMLVVVLLGPFGNVYGAQANATTVAPLQTPGPVWAMMRDFNAALNGAPVPLTDWAGKPILKAGATAGSTNPADQQTGPAPLFKFYDPTPNAVTGAAGGGGVANAATIFITPSLVFWILFVFVFSYLGALLPIWRYTQPVNYIGFWMTALTIVGAAVGALLSGLGSFLNIAALTPAVSQIQLVALNVDPKGLDVWKWFNPGAGGMIQPLWPMLFVTIACGSISGWHALIGSVGTSRQLEYETDALPVGGGGMLSENALGLVALMAVAVAGSGAGGGRFAQGIGKFLSVFGLSEPFGRAIGFAAFVIIVLTVVQLLFRVMRVTLTEWVGDSVPVVRNPHVSTLVSMLLTFLLVISGTWIYLWQLFGASNQLMAALSLLIVTVWLRQTGKNAAFALWPTLFMYVTTMAATLVTAYNMWATVLFPKGQLQTDPFALGGGIAMVAIAALLFVLAAYIGYDGWQAWNRAKPAMKPVTAPGPAAE
ncbi:MAG TPA: carbon starvation CstA family protein [Anaerolineae bacterium]